VLCCAGTHAILQPCVPLLQWTLGVGQNTAMHGAGLAVCNVFMQAYSSSHSVTYKIVPQLEAVLNAAKDLAMLTCSMGTLQTCGGSTQEGDDLGRSVAQAHAMPDCPQSWVSQLPNSLECDWCLQLYTMPNCVDSFEL